MVSIENTLENIILVGDRVLVKPKSFKERTKTGLYLPPGVQEREKIQSGYIIKSGPGYPIPIPTDMDDEPWKEKDESVKYIPLQAKSGDLAIFLQNSAHEITYNNEKYFIVPHTAILMLVREDLL
ncbi:co-chaperone GroES family protein [Cytophagaceae bacterium ABcell3]|nr:co-chaperone GroES family protein [Cytophagaceae bacterium ABcell3]